jgi:hypothetical protein
MFVKNSIITSLRNPRRVITFSTLLECVWYVWICWKAKDVKASISYEIIFLECFKRFLKIYGHDNG